MKTVAKILIKHSEEYLMMYRSDHPTFGVDPDLPGGTGEDGESQRVTALREVYEETGLKLKLSEVRKIYAGTDYSRNGTFYALFIAELAEKPAITMSWEHSSFEWVSRTNFVDKAASANDTYMHMAAETLRALEHPS